MHARANARAHVDGLTHADIHANNVSNTHQTCPCMRVSHTHTFHTHHTHMCMRTYLHTYFGKVVTALETAEAIPEKAS